MLARMSPDSLPSVSLAANRFQMKSGTICSCVPTTHCLAPAAIYHSVMNETTDIYYMTMDNTPIKGMKVGCTPLEGVLSSTLECYFDLSCIQLLVMNASIVKPLSSTQLNRFLPNTTIEQLVNNLFVEQWSFGFVAANYFRQCAPLTCTYSYTHRTTILNIITIIIGVLGGLSTALRIISPWLVQSFIKLERKFFHSSTNRSPTRTVHVDVTPKSSELFSTQMQ